MTPGAPLAAARSLRRTLILPVLALALLTGLALAVVAWYSASEMRRVSGQVADVRRANALVFRLNELASDAQRALLSYRFRTDEALAAGIDAADARVALLVSDVGRLDLPPRGRALWDAYIAAREGQLRIEHALLDAIRGGREHDVRVAFGKWDVTTARASALLSDFSTYNVKRLDRTVAELEARRTRSVAFLLLLLGLAAAVAVPLSLFVTRQVARPLLAMSEVADRVAREKAALSVEFADRADEIGVLARAFNAMTEDLVSTNARLAGALRVRDEFLSIASHELKTPLTSLRLQLDGVARRLTARGEPVPPFVVAAQRQARRLDALIGQLLDVSRIRAGRLALERVRCDLGDIAADVAARLGVELERAGCALRLEIEPGVVGVWDPGRLDQVVTNLLTNAAKYAPGAPVTVRARGDGTRAVLEVEDGGAGIPAELRGHVFEPYERGESTRAMGGLGLGLFIVRQIVEAHGGAVSVGEGPGGGARFVVVLPRDEVARAGASQAPEAAG